MKRKIIALMLVSLAAAIYGCTAKTRPAPANPFVVWRHTLGIDLAQNGPGIVLIRSVAVKSPAEKAGILVGDIITAIDGSAVHNRIDVVNQGTTLTSIGPVSFRVAISRSGAPMEFLVQSNESTLAKDYFAVLGALYRGEPVRLAIIPGEFTNLAIQGDTLAEWRKAYRSRVLTMYENQFLSGFGKEDKFGIVDRAKVDSVLAELKLQLTGIVSQETSVKVGDMLGATHLLFVEIARFRIGNGFRESITRRLVDVKAGQVIASVAFEEPVR